MAELNISQNYLSKVNTTYLYKTILETYKLNNITKQNKELLIAELIKVMKKIYKTLNLSKINETNIELVKKQYNNLCIKDIEIFTNTINNTTHDRKFERDFNTIKKKVTISERPVLTDSSQYVNQSKNGPDAYKSMDLNSRLKELEDSRRGENVKPNIEIPDFLKQIKVGKQSNDNNNHNISKKPEVSGYMNDNTMNFEPISISTTSNKYNESLSVADRL